MSGRYLVLAIIILLFPAIAFSEPAPDRKTAPTGFYEGVLLLSVHSGSTVEESGSLIRHEKSVATTNRALAFSGVLPLRLLGTQAMSPVFGQPTNIQRGNQSFFELEYGWTKNIGLGLLLTGMSMDVRRQELFPIPTSLATEPMAYLEVMPQRQTFYEDGIVMGAMSYHPFDNRAFDPYISGRLGYGIMKAAYRTSFDYYERWMDPEVEGYVTAGGLGIGFNAMLTTEFGLKFEISNMRRSVRSDGFSNHTIHTTSATAGIVLNWDNIRRFSY